MLGGGGGGGSRRSGACGEQGAGGGGVCPGRGAERPERRRRCEGTMAESSDKLYRVEYAKSGRASCKKCSESIPKDSLRMAIMVQVRAAALCAVGGGGVEGEGRRGEGPPPGARHGAGTRPPVHPRKPGKCGPELCCWVGGCFLPCRPPGGGGRGERGLLKLAWF